MLAVPIAMGLGYWVDRQFESAPVGLIVGSVVGFLAMLLRVMRMRPPETNDDSATEEKNESDQ